jgi:hypothetical protein
LSQLVGQFLRHVGIVTHTGRNVQYLFLRTSKDYDVRMLA